jgi:hypothetical protein
VEDFLPLSLSLSLSPAEPSRDGTKWKLGKGKKSITLAFVSAPRAHPLRPRVSPPSRPEPAARICTRPKGDSSTRPRPRFGPRLQIAPQPQLINLISPSVSASLLDLPLPVSLSLSACLARLRRCQRRRGCLCRPCTRHPGARPAVAAG